MDEMQQRIASAMLVIGSESQRLTGMLEKSFAQDLSAVAKELNSIRERNEELQVALEEKDSKQCPPTFLQGDRSAFTPAVAVRLKTEQQQQEEIITELQIILMSPLSAKGLTDEAEVLSHPVPWLGIELKSREGPTRRHSLESAQESVDMAQLQLQLISVAIARQLQASSLVVVVVVVRQTEVRVQRVRERQI